MDEVITCDCGCQLWIIGTSGTRCSKCGRFIEVISVIDVSTTNYNLKVKTKGVINAPLNSEEV